MTSSFVMQRCEAFMTLINKKPWHFVKSEVHINIDIIFSVFSQLLSRVYHQGELTPTCLT